VITDVSDFRREQANRFGADVVIDPRKEDIVALDLGVDCFIDASGAVPAIRSGIHAVRPGGVVVLVGMGAADVPLPVPVIQNRELSVTGVFRYANTWPTAIDLVTRGVVNLDALVTGHFGLSEVETAFRSTTQEGTIKSVVDPRRL
jgi:L-iditol 2-dehydrogenase